MRYLLGRTPGVTVVQLTGVALHLIAEACSVARTLAPAMVVVEDVDLIAEDRGEYPGQHPLLFQLLNEMDGLAEDADVVFVLTTNRADVLEPALAARPGRVDQAVELGPAGHVGPPGPARAVPGRPAARPGPPGPPRRADRGGHRVVPQGAAAPGRRDRSDGRRRRRRGWRNGAPDEGAEPMVVTAADMDEALRELQDTRNAMTRVLLGGADAG